MRTNIIINPDFKQIEVSIQEIPYIFGHSGENIYEARNILKNIQAGDITLNIKSFKVPNVINQFVYGNFRPSKAKRSYEYALILQERGINTPAPVGYIEQKKGICFRNSYYISLFEEFDGMLRELRRGKLEGREDFLRQFARFTADVHDKEVLHIDYSPGNILYKRRQDRYEFYLVDLNRMHFGKVSMTDGCKNLQKLWGSEEMIRFIAREYAIARDFDPQECIDLTLEYHRQFWIKFSRGRKDRKPYFGDEEP